MPHHHVRGMEISAVKFQHGHAGQTRPPASLSISSYAVYGQKIVQDTM